MTPLKKDKIAPEERRKPFSLKQIAAFFSSPFYKGAVDKNAPYSKSDREWRFWLPLISLFMGMRPVEICQLLVNDIRCTEKGTWYVDIAPSSLIGAEKTVKTASSRRRIPLHPELIDLGFLAFVETQRTAGNNRLFVNLRGDTYGNMATYAARRFREKFLPEAISVDPHQTFYSFRHSFRDALRRAEASDQALKALGGWTQHKAVSDHYGADFDDPDQSKKWITKVTYPGLDLAGLKARRSVWSVEK